MDFSPEECPECEDLLDQECSLESNGCVYSCPSCGYIQDPGPIRGEA